MTTRATVARHRAEVTKTNSLAVIAKAVGDNAGGMGRQAAVIAAASGLVLTSGIAANAADTNVQREAASASTLRLRSAAPAIISAASTIAISYEKPAVTTTPAPVEEPEPVVEAAGRSGRQACGSHQGRRPPPPLHRPPGRCQRQGPGHPVRSLRPAGRQPGLHHAGDQLPGRRGNQLPRLARWLPRPSAAP